MSMSRCPAIPVLNRQVPYPPGGPGSSVRVKLKDGHPGGSGPPAVTGWCCMAGRVCLAGAGRAQPWPMAWPWLSVTVTHQVDRVVRAAAAARSRARSGSRGPIPAISPGRSARSSRVSAGMVMLTRPANPGGIVPGTGPAGATTPRPPPPPPAAPLPRRPAARRPPPPALWLRGAAAGHNPAEHISIPPPPGSPPSPPPRALRQVPPPPSSSSTTSPPPPPPCPPPPPPLPGVVGGWRFAHGRCPICWPGRASRLGGDFYRLLVRYYVPGMTFQGTPHLTTGIREKG